jgi:hypothetical protein
MYKYNDSLWPSISRTRSKTTSMHFHSLLISLLPALTLCTTLPPRQLLPTGQTVKQDVINIHNAVLALDETVKSFNGAPLPTSLIEGTPVLLGVANIHIVNRAGFRHALAATPFSVEDSDDVIDTVVNTGMSCSPCLSSAANWKGSQCQHSEFAGRSQGESTCVQRRQFDYHGGSELEAVVV